MLADKALTSGRLRTAKLPQTLRLQGANTLPTLDATSTFRLGAGHAIRATSSGKVPATLGLIARTLAGQKRGHRQSLAVATASITMGASATLTFKTRGTSMLRKRTTGLPGFTRASLRRTYRAAATRTRTLTRPGPHIKGRVPRTLQHKRAC